MFQPVNSLNPTCISPGVLVGEMEERRFDEESNKLLVLDLVSNQWVHMPDVDVYCLGFPCTPWSLSLGLICVPCPVVSLRKVCSWFSLRRGEGQGFRDKNCSPLHIGIYTIKVAKPRVFALECATGLSLCDCMFVFSNVSLKFSNV